MAAEVIVDSILNGGAVHVFDTGHIINSELIYRAGGLLLLKPLKYVFNVENPVRMRDNIVPIKYKEGMADFIWMHLALLREMFLLWVLFQVRVQMLLI